MKELNVRITLTEELLGMAPSDPKIHEKYIASQAPDAPSTAQEVEALGVEEVVEKQMTIFPRSADGTPIIWDYQIKGFFKDSVGMLRRIPGTACSKVKAFKKEIDGLMFVRGVAPRSEGSSRDGSAKPNLENQGFSNLARQILIHTGGDLGRCQRPLRTSGPTGERTALANSETVPAGSTMEFKLILLVDDMEKWVRECLDYGAVRGLGQWRNSGKGTFTYEIIGAAPQSSIEPSAVAHQGDLETQRVSNLEG